MAPAPPNTSRSSWGTARPRGQLSPSSTQAPGKEHKMPEQMAGDASAGVLGLQHSPHSQGNEHMSTLEHKHSLLQQS